jgi:geranylgeranyl reductase family protein
MSACDVMVVGLGPAGASAARTAAQAGAHVVAIDRKRTIGVPVQCAEFIPLPIGRCATVAGVRVQAVDAMHSVLPSGAALDSPFRGLMVDRARFDQALAQGAVSAGASVRAGTLLVDIDVDARIARLRDADGERELRYRAIVAADGPHSRVAALAGLPALETVETRQYAVPLLRATRVTTVWLSDDYPGGYAWLFPKGEIANLGLGMDPAIDRDMKGPLDTLHAQLAAEGAVGREVLSRTGGAIPVGGLRESLVCGDILFAGDAAGLTHPITGAGIAPAVVSGELAGEAAARGTTSEYDAEIRDQFGPSLDRAVARRRWLAARWRTAEARRDAMHRRGWIAFHDYMEGDHALAA